MAKKQKPKALFSVKHDFYDSLDAYAQAGLNFLFSVETALQLNQISEPAAAMVREKMEAFRAAMSDEGNDDA
jgi:hypothetical protein